MKKRIITCLVVVISLFLFPKVALADTGPKPSIDVNIKNLNTSNYLVDLFVYDENGENYDVPANYNGGGLTEEQINKLHELNFDGWISESTRWDQYILFANCAGNENFQNHFSYFGTPERYKVVIVNNDTGEVKISKEIVRKDFNSTITIDYNNMDDITSSSNNSKTIVIGIIALVTTIVVELVVALLFKTGNYVTIGLTNLVTNVGLQVALILLATNCLLTFIIGEIIVILTEMVVYLVCLKKVTKVKTIIYCLVANAVTIGISLLLYKI